MQDELGRSIAKVASRVPGGMLIFYPSYALMDQIYTRWQESGVLREIQAHKPVFCEPKKAVEY